MTQINRADAYEHWVGKKYNLYNSMFLGLPFPDIKNTGTLLPILQLECEKGLESNLSPSEIMDNFFEKHTDIHSEKGRIDFMFKVIQYVERQVVLFDAIEDATFTKLQTTNPNLSVSDIIKQENRSSELNEVLNLLSDFSVRLVFTAHPTQFYPLTVLDIINGLRKDVQNDRIDKMDLHLQQLGLTSFIQKEKPTPFMEASNIIYYLRQVYYHAITDYYTQLKSIFPENEFENPNLLRIGFWPGGDRDGNPFVTSQTTLEVAQELRATLMKCYYNDTKKLEKKLTFDKTYPLISELRKALYDSIFQKQESVSYTYILDTLEKIKTELIDSYNSLFIKELESFIHSVSIFKNHFATLDIRQDHSVHEEIIRQLFVENKVIQKNISELTREELHHALFEKNLNASITFKNDPNAVLKETFDNFKTIATLQKLGGEMACNRYIISNSEDENAVLFVLALFKIQGYTPEEINVDIVPLFETMLGMQESDKIMRGLFHLPVYKAHIAQRKHAQTIMLGFSDGTKDGGYLKANWSIFKTKEDLSALCAEENIKVFFFDGRGGPPARGGGKTHRFYAAQSDRIANNDIELTVQGQTITSTYGTQEQFLYNCDQMLAAGLQNHLASKDSKVISENQRALIEELSELSFKAYERLKHHDNFIPYLEKMSTLQYYGKANIGSRPGKRGKSKELTLSDLRAISFVGAWSQLKQNVPGYFGIGTAIETFKKEGRIDQVKMLWNEVPFFNALLKNSMMSIEKSNFALTSYMSENPQFGSFWNILHDEYKRTKQLLLEISDYHSLMEEEPVSKSSIQQRESIVLPLLTIQQYALLQIQSKTENYEVYEKLVVRSLYGNINASRNSA